MTISKNLNNAINANIEARNFAQEVTVISESKSGDNFSLYSVQDKNNIIFQQVPGSSNIIGKGILGFVGGDKSRPTLIGGATSTTNAISSATPPSGPGGDWPVADTTDSVIWDIKLDVTSTAGCSGTITKEGAVTAV